MAGVHRPMCCLPTNEATGEDEPPRRISFASVTKALDSYLDASKEEVWTVSLERPQGALLGARVVHATNRKALVVTFLASDGCISSWNSSHPTQQLRAGDMILEVGDVVGEPAALEEALHETFDEGGVVKLKVARLIEFTLGMDAKVQGVPSLGIAVDDDLIITQVNPHSAAWTQNADLPPQLRVRAGDKVVAVNCQHDAGDARELLRSASYVDLVLRRPTPGELPWTPLRAHQDLEELDVISEGPAGKPELICPCIGGTPRGIGKTIIQRMRVGASNIRIPVL